MHFAPSAEQREMQAGVREVLQRGCTPNVVRGVWSGDAQAWERVSEATLAAGLSTAMVGEEHGGVGLDDVDAALLFEEAGAVALPGPALETAVAAALLAEAAPGSDVAATWLRRVVDDGASLTIFGGPVTYAVEADRCAGAVRLYPEDGRADVAAIAELDVHARPSLDSGRRMFSIEGTGHAVSADAEKARDRAATLCAAQAIGVAAAMITMSVAYATDREQFGRPIGSFQAVSHRLARAHVLVETARPVVQRAAWSVANDESDRGLRVSIAWLQAMRASRVAAEAALMTHGAIGYTWDCDLHLWLKRATALQASWGGEAWHLRRTGAAMREGGIPGIVALIR